MNLDVQVAPADGPPPAVEYRWDPDTDILTATMRDGTGGEGMSGSVEIAGSDGSWVILDVHGGRIRGVEIVVWPDVRKVPDLVVPTGVENALVVVPADPASSAVAHLHVDTTLVAEADQAERVIHFKLGPARTTRALRIARDVVVDIDDRSRIAGLWLLNVPPFPAGE